MVPFLVACGGPVRIDGEVQASRGENAPAVGARILLHDEDFQLYAETTTAEDGSFSVMAPRGAAVHLVVRTEDGLDINFPGQSGFADVFTVPRTSLWAFPKREETRWREDFAGCPGALDAPGMIVGETVLALDIDDPSQGPIEQFGLAYAYNLEAGIEASRIDACYLDDEGVAYKPDAVATGPSGRFAIFGHELGPLEIVVGRFTSGGTLINASEAFVPEGGVVSMHPALVPF